MSTDNLQIRESINQLLRILDKYPDEPKYTQEFVVYIKSFLKIQTKSLPSIEVMTLIKHRKPIIFSALRKMASRNLMLDIMTGLSTDLEIAKENLNKYLN